MMTPPLSSGGDDYDSDSDDSAISEGSDSENSEGSVSISDESADNSVDDDGESDESADDDDMLVDSAHQGSEWDVDSKCSIVSDNSEYSTDFDGSDTEADTVEEERKADNNNNDDDDEGFEDETELQVACRKGEIEDVMKLLRATDKKDMVAPLHSASMEGHLEIVKLLLARGAQDNTVGSDGFTALYYAANNGDAQVTKVLLDFNADPNIETINKITPLHIAIWQCQGEYQEVVELLVKKNGNPNSEDGKGETPLHYAAERGLDDTALCLLNNGADPFVENDRGESPLDFIWRENLPKSDAWIQKIHENEWKEALEKCDYIGMTPLHVACQQGKVDRVNFLLEHGVDADVRDDSGHTPLFYASEIGSLKIVSLLIENDADPNLTADRKYNADGKFRGVMDGRTPLFLACQNNFPQVVAHLLANGADPYLCNREDKIPADVSGDQRDVQQLLLIKEYLDRKDLGKNFKKYYEVRTGTYKKVDPPELKELIHDLVKYPSFASKFREIIRKDPAIANCKDSNGRTVSQVACIECRKLTFFMGRFELQSRMKHKSATSIVWFALDWEVSQDGEWKEGKPMALKFFSKKEHYENETKLRRTKNGQLRLSGEFVARDLMSFSGEKDKEFAKACKAIGLPTYCVVLERGECTLLDIILSEDLNELEARSLLLKFCEALHYLHKEGYIHGDANPSSFLRYPQGDDLWKLVDFDSCSKIGESFESRAIGRTGYLPPEAKRWIAKGKDSDLKADPSFDVWSFGMTMYQLLAGRSFFHCTNRGDLIHTSELASLNSKAVKEKLEVVDDPNGRELLAAILKIDPGQRLSMKDIQDDIYFHPSDNPQGGQASRESKSSNQESSKKKGKKKVTETRDDKSEKKKAKKKTEKKSSTKKKSDKVAEQSQDKKSKKKPEKKAATKKKTKK